jgi:hypothetical protein
VKARPALKRRRPFIITTIIITTIINITEMRWVVVKRRLAVVKHHRRLLRAVSNANLKICREKGRPSGVAGFIAGERAAGRALTP